MEEVRKQLAPFQKTVDEIKTETLAQTKKIWEFDHWRKALWGNGSGTPGFLEKARQEDNERYEGLKEQMNLLVIKDQQSLGAKEERAKWFHWIVTIVKLAIGSGAGAYVLEHFIKSPH